MNDDSLQSDVTVVTVFPVAHVISRNELVIGQNITVGAC